jgi:hypothetical protein
VFVTADMHGTLVNNLTYPTVWQTFSVQPVIGADFGGLCASGEDDEH